MEVQLEFNKKFHVEKSFISAGATGWYGFILFIITDALQSVERVSVELPLILRILFIGTCWSEVGESILTPMELEDGEEGEGEEEEEEDGDGADGRDDICAEAGGSVLKNNGLKLKMFQTRAKIKTANIELNLDNIQQQVSTSHFNMILGNNFITEIQN